MMEDRVSRLEDIARLSVTLSRIMEENLSRLEQDQRRAEQEHRRAEEAQQRRDEAQQLRDEVLQQLIQAVAVLQADIVRIDETHS